MSIFIATIVNGRGIQYVGRWENKKDYFLYCDSVCAFTDTTVNASMTIADLCDAMTDKGPCTGARYHKRVTLKEAQALGWQL